MEGRVLQDGNILGRLGALAFIVLVGVVVARLSCGDAVCPLGGRCFPAAPSSESAPPAASPKP